MAHDTEVKAVLRAYQKALDALQRLDKARRNFRSALLTAHEAGANKAELARALGVSRQRVDEVLTRARHERAAGVEDVTDQEQGSAGWSAKRVA
jgi:DNA-directed RNA polymerase specialized sigma24 family protein